MFHSLRTSQLPTPGRRRPGVEHRYLDAAYRAGLLVLTGLGQHSARAVGIVMALQFSPQILLLALGDTPLVGWVADHLAPRRSLGVDAL